MVLFEEYRGFDISDKVQAVQVTPDNIHVLAEITGGDVREEPNGIPVALQMPGLSDADSNQQVAVKLWDFLVKGSGDDYKYWPNEKFKHAFARNI